MKTEIYFWSYLAQFFLEWEMFYAKVEEDFKKIHFVFHNVLENRAVFLDMWKKYWRAGQGVDGSMAHAYCLLNSEG
jgi:hypothetical protein